MCEAAAEPPVMGVLLFQVPLPPLSSFQWWIWLHILLQPLRWASDLVWARKSGALYPLGNLYMRCPLALMLTEHTSAVTASPQPGSQPCTFCFVRAELSNMFMLATDFKHKILKGASWCLAPSLSDFWASLFVKSLLQGFCALLWLSWRWVPCLDTSNACASWLTV